MKGRAGAIHKGAYSKRGLPPLLIFPIRGIWARLRIPFVSHLQKEKKQTKYCSLFQGNAISRSVPGEEKIISLICDAKGKRVACLLGLLTWSHQVPQLSVQVPQIAKITKSLCRQVPQKMEAQLTRGQWKLVGRTIDTNRSIAVQPGTCFWIQSNHTPKIKMFEHHTSLLIISILNH